MRTEDVRRIRRGFTASIRGESFEPEPPKVLAHLRSYARLARYTAPARGCKQREAEFATRQVVKAKMLKSKSNRQDAKVSKILKCQNVNIKQKHV